MKGQYSFQLGLRLPFFSGDEEVASWLHPVTAVPWENISKGMPPDRVILSWPLPGEKPAASSGRNCPQAEARDPAVYRLLGP